MISIFSSCVTIVEILAEYSFAHSLAHIHIGGSYDTNTIRVQQWEKGISCPPIGWHEDSKAMECKTTANPDLWDTKGGRMIGKSMQALEVNRKLDKMRVHQPLFFVYKPSSL